MNECVDESIDASPQRSLNSTHEKWERRKARKRRSNARSFQLSKQFKDEAESCDTNKSTNEILDIFTCDSEDDSDLQDQTSSRKIGRIVFPKNGRFMAENMMAKADRRDLRPQKKHAEQMCKPTDEFLTCEKLLQSQSIQTQFVSCESKLESSCKLEKVNGNRFPLINVCDINESGGQDGNLASSTAHEQKNSNVVVNNILRDFCTSPTTSIEDIEDFEPFFRFRRKSIRTYERFFRQTGRAETKKNISNLKKKILEKPALISLDDSAEDSDVSSELSVQEQIVQFTPQVEPLVFDTSGPVHSNLLNLSAFFTQNVIEEDVVEGEPTSCGSNEKLSTTMVETITSSIMSPVISIIKEILTLREKYKHFTLTKPLSRANSIDFLGFEDNCLLNSEIGDGDGNKLNTLNNACNEQISMKRNTLVGGYDEDIYQNDEPDSASYCDFKASRLSILFKRDVICQDFPKTRRASDSLLESVSKTKETVVQIQRSLSNEAIPNDDTVISGNELLVLRSNLFESQIFVEDILKQFDGPKNVEKEKLKLPKDLNVSLDKEFDDFLFSEWPIEKETILEADNNKQSSIICDNIQSVLPNKTTDFELNLCEPDDNYKIVEPTTSNHHVENLLDDVLLSQWQIDDETIIKKQNIEKDSTLLNNTTEQEDVKVSNPLWNTRLQNVNAPTVAFQTASFKNINISEAALKRVENVFADIPELEENKNVKDMQISTSSTIVSESVSNRLPSFDGFKTASSKNIKITEEALKRAENIFADIPEVDETTSENSVKQPETVFHQKQNSNVAFENNKSNFVGYTKTNDAAEVFCNSDIKITTTKNIQNITEKSLLPKKHLTDCIPDLGDVQLSEWLPSGSPPHQSSVKDAAKTPEMKQRSHVIESPSTSTPPLRKLLCKSNAVHEHVSLSHTPSTSRLEESLTKAPKSTSASRSSFIVRRSSLSLAKRSKHKLKLQQNNELVKNQVQNKIMNDETPIKSVTRTISNETPNANEFYTNIPIAASTPQIQLNLTNTPNRFKSVKNAENFEADFLRINWEQNEVCSTPSRAHCSSLNETEKVQPSPQQRIENLSDCGDPPPLPQLVNSNNSRCRSLGLSKRKSFIKKL